MSEDSKLQTLDEWVDKFQVLRLKWIDRYFEIPNMVDKHLREGRFGGVNHHC